MTSQCLILLCSFLTTAIIDVSCEQKPNNFSKNGKESVRPRRIPCGTMTYIDSSRCLTAAASDLAFTAVALNVKQMECTAVALKRSKIRVDVLTTFAEIFLENTSRRPGSPSREKCYARSEIPRKSAISITGAGMPSSSSFVIPWGHRTQKRGVVAHIVMR